MLKNKFYIGYHKGFVDDGYVCSGKHMLKEYKIRHDDFVRHILADGTRNDMRHLEGKILKALHAAKNPKFYNMTNQGAPIEAPRGWHHSEKSRAAISDHNARYNLGRTFTLETRLKQAEAKKGKKQKTSTIERRRLKMFGNTATKNRKWYHNNNLSILLRDSDTIPDKFLPGRGTTHNIGSYKVDGTD